MTTMSDDGDRTCPLCTEEMDLTDQNLKPCKCGYEICVWCWHHITDMAEKDGSEGRCPACRMVYDKQKIVGMADKRMVAEIGIEKKPKSQKTKNKPSTMEDRKHLSSVRVVQRNLVYIMGMPSNLADENILERKEYFGQYGKILKVSVSRQAGIATQPASNNNTFSVYITYAREDEAIRCIQAVHNFVLEGKPLRACFGTTKYCYTWLRNLTCTNPDCLYLHDIGSQEDSFTKDEIISAYTRSRVPQIPSNNLQPRAGNVLPPVDELHNNGAVSTKSSNKVSYNNTTNQANSTPIDISVPRSTVLPAGASWGLRSSNSRSPASSIANTQNHHKEKMEVHSSLSSSTIVSSTKQNSAWHDYTVTNAKLHEGSPVIHADGRSGCFEPLKHGNVRDPLTKSSDSSSRLPLDMDHSSGSAWDDDITASKMPDGNHTVHTNGRSRNIETSKSTDTTSITDDPAESTLDEAHHSAWDDDTVLMPNMQGARKIGHSDDRYRSLGTSEAGFEYSRAYASDVTLNTFPSAVKSSGVSNKSSLDELSLQHENRNGGINASRVHTHPMNSTYSEGDISELSISCSDELTNMSAAVNENTEHLCVGLSSVNLDASLGIDCINTGQQQSSATEHCLNNNFEDVNSRIQQYYPENEAEGLAFTPGSSASAIPNAHISGKLFERKSGLWNQASSSSGNGIEAALANSDDPRLRVSAAPNSSSSSFDKNYSLNISNHLANSFQNGEVGDKRFSIDGGSRILGTELDRGNDSLLLNGHSGETQRHFVKNGRILEYPNTSYTEELCSGVFDDISNIKNAANMDKDEESIVSKIVSADFDPWDNSWSSANNFAKLLAQANKQEGPSKQSSTWMSQNNRQSRFSFARQENQASLEESSYRDGGLAHLVSSKQELYGNSIGITSPISNFEHAKVLGYRSSTISSDRTAGAMRTKISAPPGFSIPNRAPPPGFASQDRFDQTFTTFSDTQLLGSPLQNEFQVHSTSNAGDVEFIDPAILAVGKGRLPLGVNNTGIAGRLPLGVNNTGAGSRFAYHPQFSSAESDARIQLLMQQSMSANQDPRILNHVGNRFSQLDDAYTASRFSAQNPSMSPYGQMSHQQSPHILNGQWNGWNDMQNGNGMGIPDILMGERFGLNNYIPVNEEPKFHLQNSGDLYNRAFGM